MRTTGARLIIAATLAASLLYCGWRSHSLLTALRVAPPESSALEEEPQPEMMLREIQQSRLKGIRIRVKRRDRLSDIKLSVRQHGADAAHAGGWSAFMNDGAAGGLSEPVLDLPAATAGAAQQAGGARAKPAKGFRQVAGRGGGARAQQPASLPPAGQTCEAWLAQADAMPGGRDFSKEPITVLGGDGQGPLEGCDVPCHMARAPAPGARYDAHFGMQGGAGFGASVLRSMESVANYPNLDAARAHADGTDIVMTTHLNSDVPAGYPSWAEYNIMRPPEPKQEAAAAFISNCNSRSFRLAALEQLSELLPVHSFGLCLRSNQTQERKVDVLRRYHFALAFENSQEEDYVTEKFVQALEAGAVPVVIGAPNIRDYEPAPGAVLAIHTLQDVPAVAARMRYLLQNASAYEELLAWKRTGPQDSFLALLDLNVVHSSCRLCIHLATGIRAAEAAAQQQQQQQHRPCRCLRAWGGGSVYHVLVRERGRLAARDVFLDSKQLTAAALRAAILGVFEEAGHEPIWVQQRPDFRGGGGLRLYRVYPVGSTQREALYGDAGLDSDAAVADAVLSTPCLQLEVVFV